jgi:hypothetical protein
LYPVPEWWIMTTAADRRAPKEVPNVIFPNSMKTEPAGGADLVCAVGADWVA